MRRVNIDYLKEEMVLAKPIYTSHGVILLKEETVLNLRLIEKIKGIDVDFVYIEDEVSEGIDLEEVIQETTKVATREVLEESLNKIRGGSYVATDLIAQKVEQIIHEVVDNPKVMVSLQEIRSKDAYLHMHAINVCVVALLIGKKLGYNDAKLRHLAFGAILHDVGKTQIEYDMIRYRDDYVEQEMKFYKEHVRYGYEIIKEMPGGSLLAANVALSHHEHYDGGGFPLGRKNTGIHEFARIVAIANEYDNLLYNPSIKHRLPHYEIIELIVSRAYSWFDPDLVKLFRKSIAPYPIASGVLLNDGRMAIVEKIHEEFPARPVIRVVEEGSLKVIETIDLSTSLNLMIVAEKNIDK